MKTSNMPLQARASRCVTHSAASFASAVLSSCLRGIWSHRLGGAVDILPGLRARGFLLALYAFAYDALGGHHQNAPASSSYLLRGRNLLCYKRDRLGFCPRSQLVRLTGQHALRWLYLLLRSTDLAAIGGNRESRGPKPSGQLDIFDVLPSILG
jgi:hypothetical protein